VKTKTKNQFISEYQHQKTKNNMEAKYTKGEWVIDYGFTLGHIKAVKEGSVRAPTVAIYNHKSKLLKQEPSEEERANAKLIADAGNTANKCGLLPSELLEQRNELLEALQQLLNAYQETLNCEYSHSGEDNPEVIQAKQAIKKATE
jgi:hypothetical protein